MCSAGNSLKSKRYTEEEQSMSDFDLKEKRFEQDIEEVSDRILQGAMKYMSREQ